jgi:CheY-like chemotaxis protein
MHARILWVEDKADEVVAVMSALRALGHTVDHAPDRLYACGLLDGGRVYDMIILDELMKDPECDSKRSGYVFFQALRKATWGQWGAHVPVLFVTAYAEIIRALIGPLPPEVAIIHKPVARDAGAETIQQHLELHIHVFGDAHTDDHHLEGDVFDAGARSSLGYVCQHLRTSDNPRLAEAAERLRQVLAAQMQEHERQRAVNSFREWVSSAGDEVKKGLAVAAHLATVAAPVLTALGIPR